MKVIRAKNLEDIERLKPLALEWQESCNAKEMGIELIPETHYLDLAGLIDKDDAELFLLVNDDDSVVGYMGMRIFDSPLGNQTIANEHLWYVSKEHRTLGTVRILNAAKRWAKEKGCTHLILNASNLASDMHDKVCRFYERIGFKKFETSYIQVLR